MTTGLTTQRDKLKPASDTRLNGAPTRVVSRMLLDQSGSMAPHAIPLLEGAADYLEAMREQTITTLIAFDLFDNAFDPGPSALAMQTPYLTEERYHAGGDTALYDSILKTIHMAAQDERPSDRVLISIFTDGHDTCSRADIGNVRREVQEKQRQGWTFVFGGPHKTVGTDLGIKAENVFQLKGGNIKGVLAQIVQRTVTLLLPPKGGTIHL